ncbi:acetate--CoA ligase [Desulfofundulus thermocisternus]|uniref:acetate--CoA ligase n=1 Tax=Desulfofundulus thermocisternus TaxID=42471 RepID=UPI0019E18B8C|nr:acetate--CoA ligase [Desulfofundulus thermocisternus]MBE3586096.1 acetate--CoA ligase [Thermoanaerobacter sp.]MCS5694965.1 acetate--CoA ligase [Desulfofundulus thermocisternus]
MASEERVLETLLKEERTFPPPAYFVEKALVKDASIYEEAKADREGFWAKQAESIDWFQKWDKVLDTSNAPFFKWFVNGKLNASYNCIDRHLKTWRRTKAAIIWEGEPGDDRVLTYQDLYREVTKCANVLKELGIKRGDRVTIYLPMIPELAIAMLACARIGAPHSVVFGGFSAESLRDRINDCQAKLVITADGGWRRGGIVPLKKNCDDALAQCPSVEKVLMVKRTGQDVNFVEGRDYWWHEMMARAPIGCEPEHMDAEDMLYILYTSGTTGKPKGVVHTTGGYLVGVAATHRMIFDIKDDDIYWCTADIGWVTGHSYIVYGPLANGCTTVMYEGSPDWPERDRFWAIVEKYRVNILYTAPTAIRAFMRWGTEWPARRDLSSLRLLGTVGEPINPEAWMWYYKYIGNERCPIVDTWWQTETGMILISPLPGVTTLKPGSATVPFPGVEAAVVDNTGKEVPLGSGGYLILKSPWPAMLRTIYGDPDRYVAQYWSRFENVYFTGDGARWDEDGYFWIMGRVDDVINVSGHRLGTMEIESALVDHPAVAEAAVIGKAHEVKGQAVSAFVTLKEGIQGTPELANELKAHVVKKIGAIARPEDIFFTAELPKTRSGKIMRRLLRDIAEGRVLGDTTTLADPAVVAQIKEQYESKEM